MRFQQKRSAFPLQSLGMSAEVRRRLPPGSVTQILSTFRRGLTVVPQDDLQGRPIFVSPAGEGLLPEHVVITRANFKAVMAECRSGDLITFLPRHQFTLEMPILAADRTILQQGLRFLEARVASKRPTGLDVPSSEILAAHWEWAEIFGCDWTQSPPQANEDRRRLLLRRLIGRGRGSTPAGDDLLIGALAFLTAYQEIPRDRTFFDTLHALEPEMPVLTTRTSEVYLYWALRGVFSSDIIRLTTALLTGDTARMSRGIDGLLNHGDTSGLDTLVGLILMVRGCGFGGSVAGQ